MVKIDKGYLGMMMVIGVPFFCGTVIAYAEGGNPTSLVMGGIVFLFCVLMSAIRGIDHWTPESDILYLPPRKRPRSSKSWVESVHQQQRETFGSGNGWWR